MSIKSRVRRSPAYITPSSFEEYYPKVATILKQKICGQLSELEVMEKYNIPVYVKWSPGNVTVPAEMGQIWIRWASLIRRLVENPCGVDTVRKMYTRSKRGTDLRPDKKYLSSGAFARRSLRLLAEKELIRKIPKGYHTTALGKSILLEAL